MIKRFVFTLVFILLLSGLSMAEVIKLKGNIYIQGKILKKTSKLIIIDLGYDVLRIPRSEIVETLEQMPQSEAKVDKKNNLFASKAMAEISGIRIHHQSAGACGHKFSCDKGSKTHFHHPL